MKAKKRKRISTKELDKKFDEGKDDVLEHFDTDNAIRRILVDFPEWMIKEFDSEAKRLGIARQAVIKTWLADRIQQNKKEEQTFAIG